MMTNLEEAMIACGKATDSLDHPINLLPPLPPQADTDLWLLELGNRLRTRIHELTTPGERLPAGLMADFNEARNIQLLVTVLYEVRKAAWRPLLAE